MRRAIRSFTRDCTGSLTVEFVALTPMLFVALIFAIDFGRTLWAYDTVVRDMRAAVRYLSRASGDCSTNRTEAENFAKTGLTSGGTAHFPWNNGTPTFSYISTNFTTAQYNVAGTIITMTASVPVTILASGFQTFFNKYTTGTITAPTLSVSYQARCIGN